jgi:predicted permease
MTLAACGLTCTSTMPIRALFDNAATDARQALRSLRRSPGFAAVALLALALGIGGTTAIFSVVDATRAQAIPYRDPQQLVLLIGTARRTVVERRGASYPDFLDWRAQATRVEGLAAFDSQRMTLGGIDDPERIGTEFVSASYFPLLDVTPALGRTFGADEDDVARPAAVVVLSDALWKRRFAADPAVVGRAITLNGQPYTVLGVMAPGFTGITDEAQAWIPFAQYAPLPTMRERGTRGFTVLGRLRPAVTVEAAQAELDAISARLAGAYPETNEGRAVEVSPLATEVFGTLRLALQILMGAITLVLVIACANVANLLIARSDARRQELALRAAIGAGRGRLLQQLVTESCVLTLVGAAAGLVLAEAAVRLLLAQSPVTLPSILTPSLDARVAAFTILVSLSCGLGVGLAPWWQIRLADLSNRLRETSRSSDGPRSQRLRNGLVVAEVALAVVLLVSAGLMVQSVRNLAAIDPGFDPASLLTVHVSVPRAVGARDAAGGPPPPVATGRELLERIAAVPGVLSVALGNDVPLDGNAGAVFYSVEGHGPFRPEERPRAWLHRVSPGFFDTLGIRLMAGRTFLDTELTPTPSAVIVSERVVARFWPGEDPIGKQLILGSAPNAQSLSVVGVTREVRYRSIRTTVNTDPDIYLPFADRNAQIALAIRTNVPPPAVAAPVRAAIRSADPSIAIYDVEPMEARIARQSSLSRFSTWMMGVFAGVALWLCALGIYGVMSYAVSQRTREIGIRLALGASPWDVLQRVAGSGVRLIAAGMAIGSAAAAALHRAASTQLVDVPLTQTATGVALGLFAVVGLVACLVPAVRATRVDPVQALHQE